MGNIELERYRQVLEEKNEDLRKTIPRRDAIAVQRSADAIDELQSMADRELAVTDLDRISRLIRNVKEALSRIREGTFGVCLECEDPISPARLNAVPWTPFCIRCQQAIDEEQSSDRKGIHLFGLQRAA